MKQVNITNDKAAKAIADCLERAIEDASWGTPEEVDSLICILQVYKSLNFSETAPAPKKGASK